MENIIDTIDTPAELKLIVFEKPNRGDQVVAAIAGAALTVIATTVISVGGALIKHGLTVRAEKKLAAKREASTAAEEASTEETEEDHQD